MKKKLQSQLKELAARILKQEPDEAVSTMKLEARELYEKLSVLEYLESQIMEEEVPQKMEESMDSKSYREQNWFQDPKPVPEPENKEELVEPATEKIKDIVAQMPEESQEIDDYLKDVIPPKAYQKNDLEEFASHYQQMPVFERKDTSITPTKTAPETLKEVPAKELQKTHEGNRPKSLNESLNSGLNIGLNDRLAFIKHLFDGNAEDYTRVLSQISTLESFEQAATFIKTKGKPDYNYWLQKEEYAERFMNLVEKRFN